MLISDSTTRGKAESTGLKKAFFKDMTDIQTESLSVSLEGKDIFGAPRTGSGKTLEFLVPVLEILYRRKWEPSDRLGALIISPTRKLVGAFVINSKHNATHVRWQVVRIFEVWRSTGGHHRWLSDDIWNLPDESYTKGWKRCRLDEEHSWALPPKILGLTLHIGCVKYPVKEVNCTFAHEGHYSG